MKVLIVDDDLALADIISFTMRRAGYEVSLAYDGQMALDRWQVEQPGLVILDLNLPKVDGFTVCKTIRESSDVPIIILSVLDEDEDVVKGLKLGADDYVTKPFSPREIVARAEALLRRARSSTIQPDILQAGGFTLDPSRSTLSREDKVTHLTRLECRLLEMLMRHAGLVVTTEMLIDTIWGPAKADRSMLKQLVYRLRLKLEAACCDALQLDTVTGVGYSLRIAEGQDHETPTR